MDIRDQVTPAEDPGDPELTRRIYAAFPVEWLEILVSAVEDVYNTTGFGRIAFEIHKRRLAQLEQTTYRKPNSTGD